MFDKLEDLRIRLDEILNELQEPDVQMTRTASANL